MIRAAQQQEFNAEERHSKYFGPNFIAPVGTQANCAADRQSNDQTFSLRSSLDAERCFLPGVNFLATIMTFLTRYSLCGFLFFAHYQCTHETLKHGMLT
jgi:hypothetical protein